MSDTKRPRVEEVESLSSAERKAIFDEIYPDESSLDVNNELFKKESRELDIFEFMKYKEYWRKLNSIEYDRLNNNFLERLKCIRRETELAVDKFIDARSKLGIKTNNILDTVDLTIISNRLESLLFDLVDDDDLDEEKRKNIVEILRKFYEDEKDDIITLDKLLKALGLKSYFDIKVQVPLDSKGKPYAPHAMNGMIQTDAAKNNRHFIFPFPYYNIKTYFPVFFCHPMFVDFVDILDDRNTNKIVEKYKEFIGDDNGNIKRKLDNCVSQLIVLILSVNEEQNSYVFDVAGILSSLFGTGNVFMNCKIENEYEHEIMLDLAVFTNMFQFPFIMIAESYNSYSVDKVMKHLQSYGLAKKEFIDNDPCFLITYDRGILYIYGIAKVNCRVVCTCLLSLEFTNHCFNIQKFQDKLFKCFGALRFFFEEFSARILNKSTDPQHIKYSSIKCAPSYKNEPLPAIFSVKKEGSDERIEILFEPTDKKSFYKPGVYRVKIQDGGYAVLKIVNEYSIDVHRKLSDANLAPKLFGYEVLCDNFKIILMEYLDSPYDLVFDYIYNKKSYEVEIDRERLSESLKDLLWKLKEFGIVHGDFRANNILAKRSETNPSILEDFKLIDFEYSGNVDEPYPLIAMKNPEIKWPAGFNSLVRENLNMMSTCLIESNKLKDIKIFYKLTFFIIYYQSILVIKIVYNVSNWV